MVWQGPTIAVTSLTLVVSLSLVLTLRRPWPVQLNLTGAGSWELILSDGRIFLGEIARARVLPAVISITFSGRFASPVLLVADAFGDRDHKRLSGLLRHRCGGAS